MFLNKNSSVNIPLNDFLRQGLLEHFGSEIFNKWLSNCIYFARKKTLVIKTEDENVARFINQNLIQEIANFCAIAWPQNNIKPLLCFNNENIIQYSLELNNERTDNVVSIDQFHGHCFDDFITSNENKIAYNLMCSVAGKIKPVFSDGTIIYLNGEPGVGKTHLLKATETYALRYKTKNICYLSAEVFSSKYITAVKENKLFDLRNSLIAYDALLIDDIGFIAHRRSTMEELGSIVSIMLDNQKNVVITTTNQLSAFKEHKRLYNRLLSAIIAPIPHADSDLKYKIAKSIAQKRIPEISDEILVFLSNNLIGGAREIKGALDRIKISLSNIGRLTIPAIKNLIEDLITTGEKGRIYSNDIEMVIDKVGEYYQISICDLKNPRTIKNNKMPRSIAFYLCRKICGLTYCQIAKEFGFSAHASVIHAIKKLEIAIKNNEALLYDTDCITQNIRRSLGYKF